MRKAAIFRANFAHAWQPLDVVAIRNVDATTAYGLLIALCISQTGSLLSADAWHDITFVAGEVRNPRRNLPLGFGTGIIIVLSALQPLLSGRAAGAQHPDCS